MKRWPIFGPYELLQSPILMNEARYMAEIRDGKSVNIVWSSTSVEKERDLLPLRIPLRKGLLGYRVGFITKGNQAKIDKVKTLADLKTLTIGQGIGWGDVALYSANGIKVQTARYESLFKMANSGRFDIFPRGIGEIGPELAANSADNPDLVVEKNLLIYYPWPYYFFFNKADTALHNRVGRGIRKMMENGKFDAIFNKYNARAIQDANLKNRRIIQIENPGLPKDTPLNDVKLWFDPLKF
jgi:ABC-type amino acid transport substrate-binding protein